MKTLLSITILLILLVGCEQSHESMISGYTERYNQLIEEGWSYRAAHIISGFETDMYDRSDTLEYNEYISYMED